MRSHLMAIVPGVQYGAKKMESSHAQCRNFGDISGGFAITMRKNPLLIQIPNLRHYINIYTKSDNF